jgi:hypothetical protein
MTQELEGPSLDSDERQSSSSSGAGSGTQQRDEEEDKNSEGSSRLTESEGSTNRACDEGEETKQVFERGFDM